MQPNQSLHFASQRDADAHIVNQQIAELERNRRLTRAQAARLAVLQAQLSALHSPVHKIPDDVLSYVFELASDFGNDPRACWTISKVTSRWRRVAIETRCLWINITIKSPQKSGRSTEILPALVDRCGSCPIILTVDLSGYQDRRTGLAIMETATRYTDRAKAISLRGNRGIVWDALPHFPVTPKLRKLSISNFVLIDFEAWILFLLDCLPLCTALQRLDLSDICALVQIVEFRPKDHLRLELPNLESVTFGADLDMLPMRLFEHMRAKPKEATLPTLCHHFDHDVVDTLARCRVNFSNLQKLTLVGLGYFTCTIKTILGHTPQLQTLIVKEADLGDCHCSCAQLSLTNITLERCVFVDGIRGIIERMDETFAKTRLTVQIAERGNEPVQRQAFNRWLARAVYRVVTSLNGTSSRVRTRMLRKLTV